MKVILTQTVPGVGDAGTIKEVADGYARNFLLPKGMAVVATRSSVQQAEAQAATYAKKADKQRTALQKAADAVQDKNVVIRARAGSENRLYGSVTAADVADALLSQHGITLDRRKIQVENIHRLGTYTATADFGNGVAAKFNVEVAPEVAGATGKTTRATGAEAQPQPAAAQEADVAAADAAAAQAAENGEAGAEALQEEQEEQVEANPS